MHAHIIMDGQSLQQASRQGNDGTGEWRKEKNLSEFLKVRLNISAVNIIRISRHSQRKYVFSIPEHFNNYLEVKWQINLQIKKCEGA